MVKRLRLPALTAVPLISLAFYLLTTLSSCAVPDTATDYRTLVSPEEGMIIQLDLSRLSEKIDIESITSHPSFEGILQLSGAGSSSSFFQYLNNSGLDTESPVIMSMANMGAPKVKIYAGLESEDALIEMIGPNMDIKKQGGISYVKESGFIICWVNNMICFVSGYDDAEDDLSAFFAPSVKANPAGYNSFIKSPGDMHIWASYGGLMGDLEFELDNDAAEEMLDNLKEGYSGYRVDFEKGNIAIDMEMFTENEELSKMWRDAYKQKPNKELVSLIPPDAIALFSSSIDPEMMLFNSLGGNPLGMLSQVGVDEAGEMSELLESFGSNWGGDMMVALTGMTLGEADAPGLDMIMGMTAKDEAGAKELIQGLLSEGLIEATGEAGDRYALSADMGFDASISVEGDQIVAIAGAPNVGDANLDKDISKHFKNSAFAAYIDIHMLMDELGKGGGGLMMMMISGLVKNNFDYLLFYSLEPSNQDIAGAMHVDFKFVNEEDYSINVLAMLILEIFSSFGGMLAS